MEVVRRALPEDGRSLVGPDEGQSRFFVADFGEIYPGHNPHVWYRRWRILFLAGAELFGARRGQEWWVSHYLFEPQSRPEHDDTQAEVAPRESRETLVEVGPGSLN